ncbi:tripartite tricarboxylate transporter substrate binding protein [Shouchella shacheensis]|uniref:tripartite tricarboxylate transporter substrate binding protein n=1 Tax=Shouchella shacheensis TaxID=1649580 RepID=UPI0007401C8C|nr:tripartite tricarboxylate transporter substrate binding protein [Shouchella shacheensis]
MDVFKKRTFSPVLISGIFVLSACGNSSENTSGDEAANFPQEDLTIVVHTSAGGPTDLMARELASAMESVIEQNVIVENKPGGSGATQMADVASSNNDGYTLGAMTPSQIGLINGTLSDQYTINDFDWVSRTQIDPYILVVHDESPFETLGDLVNYASENPGVLNVGGYGATGSGHNIAFNILSESADIVAQWTPYESTGDAVTAILGQHIDVANSNPGQVSQYVENGELRVLGVMSDERLEDMPDVPTYAEEGYEVETDWAQFRGIYAPADTPEEITNALGDILDEAMQTEGYQQYMDNAQMLEGAMTPEEFTEYIQSQDELTNHWYEELGIE